VTILCESLLSVLEKYIFFDYSMLCKDDGTKFLQLLSISSNEVAFYVTSQERRVSAGIRSAFGKKCTGVPVKGSYLVSLKPIMNKIESLISVLSNVVDF